MLTGSEMNCIDFRRRLLADPHRLDQAALEHRDTCPDCAAHFARVLQLESELESAARLPVPDGLADRILLKHRLSRWGTGSWFALAAGLLLAAGLALLLPSVSYQKNTALAAIDHVLREEAQEIYLGRGMEPGTLPAVASELGLRLPLDRVQIRYAGPCPFGGGTAYHIVLGTPFGKTTLLLMPDKPLASRIVSSSEGMSAVAAPARRGSYALIAAAGSDIGQIENLIR